MMIFDANSGEFWQIFARQGMRNLRNSQLERGEVCIEDVELELKSRDDVPALLVGPQYLYSQEPLGERLFFCVTCVCQRMRKLLTTRDIV